MPRVTVSDSREHDVVCEHCNHRYAFQVVRQVTLDAFNTEASRKKIESACRQRVNRMLDREVDPVSCPACCWVSRAMVIALRQQFLRPLKVLIAFLAAAGAVLGLSCLAAGIFVKNKTIDVDWFGIAMVGGGLVAFALLVEGTRRLVCALRYPASGFTARTALGHRQLIERAFAQPASATPAADPRPAHPWARRIITSVSEEEVRSRAPRLRSLGLASLGLLLVLMGLAMLRQYLQDATHVTARTLIYTNAGGLVLLVAALVSLADRCRISRADGVLRKTFLVWHIYDVPLAEVSQVIVSVYRVSDRRYEVVRLELEHNKRRIVIGESPTYASTAIRVTRAAASISRMAGLPIVISGSCTGPSADLRCELQAIAAEQEQKA